MFTNIHINFYLLTPLSKQITKLNENCEQSSKQPETSQFSRQRYIQFKVSNLHKTNDFYQPKTFKSNK